MHQTENDKERRHFTRILFKTPCKLHQGNRVARTEVIDISLQGVLIRRPEGWQEQPGAPLRVTIDLADLENAITMNLVLCHATTSRLGFQCHDLDIDSATHLRRLVLLNLGDDKLLHRELNTLIEQN